MIMKTSKPSFHFLLNAPVLLHTITHDCKGCNCSRSANGSEGLCTSHLFILHEDTCAKRKVIMAVLLQIHVFWNMSSRMTDTDLSQVSHELLLPFLISYLAVRWIKWLGQYLYFHSHNSFWCVI